MMRSLLIYLSLFGFIGGQIARFQLGNGIAVVLIDVVVILIAAFYIGECIYKKRVHQIFQYSLSRPIIFFLGTALLSLAVHVTRYSPLHLMISSLYLFRLLSYILFFLLLLQLPHRKKQQIRSGLFVTGSVVLFFGFLQYMLYPYLGNLYYLGWDDHLYRLFSVFLDPNFAGCFFVLFSLFVTTLLFQKKRTGTSYLLGSVVVLSILAVILTFSRSAFISLLIGTGSFFYPYIPKKLLVMGLLGLCFSFLLFADFGIEGKNPLRIVSSSERVRSMEVAIHIFQKEPVLGVGFNAYRYAQNLYGFRTSEKWMNSHADAGTDNSFLFVLATTGIIGMVAFVYLLIRIFQQARSIPNQFSRSYVLSASLVVIVGGFFVNTLFYSMLLYWTFTSIATVIEQEKP